MDLGVGQTQLSNAWDSPLTNYELHHSHIQTLVGLCAKRFEHEFVTKPTGFAPAGGAADVQMNLGTAGHEVISSIISGTLTPLPQLMDNAYDKWVIPAITDPVKEGQVSDEYQKDVFAALDWVTTNFNRLNVNSELGFVIPKVSDLSPILHGISSEWKFVGHMDLVEFNDENGTAKIADLKFRSKSNYAANKASSQAPMYGLATMYYGYIPEFTYVEIIKGKVVEQKVKLTEGSYDWLYIKARQAIDHIESGNFPISPNGWWCSAKYCKWWNTCRGKYEPAEEGSEEFEG